MWREIVCKKYVKKDEVERKSTAAEVAHGWKDMGFISYSYFNVFAIFFMIQDNKIPK